MDKRRLTDFKQDYQERVQEVEQSCNDLKEEYKALWEEYRSAHDQADRVRIKRKIKNKEQEIDDLKEKIYQLDNSWLKQILNYMHNHLDIIKKAYLACRPVDYPQKRDNFIPDGIENIVKNLEKMPLQSLRNAQQQYPFWLFVTYLVEEPNVPEFIQKELREEIKKQVSEDDWFQLREAVGEIQERENNRNSEKPYLMLQVEPAIRENYFFVHAWLLSTHTCDPSHHEFCDIGPKFSVDIAFYLDLTEKTSELANNSLLQKREAFNLQEIQNFIDEIVGISTAILHTESDNSDLTIEFFLPKDLLNKPVDCWQIYNENNSLGIAIGYEYQVVVRSYERLRPRYRARNRWLAKWEQIQECQTQQASHWFFPLQECPSDPRNLFYQLDRENRIGCILQPDLLETSENINVFVDPINHAGIPIAIWLRRCLSSVHYQSELERLLNNAIAELPEVVRQQRQQARKEQASLEREEHIGYHLCLWWDNPYRLPPVKTLKTN